MKKLFSGKYSKEIGLFLILVVIFAVFGILRPDRFLTKNNLLTMAKQLPELGMMTLAIMLVILTGGNNLSNVATAILSGIIMALIMSRLAAGGMADGLCIAIGMAGGLAVALLCGMLNGLMAAIIGVAAMLATLATQTFFKGISMNITQGAAISGFPTIFYEFSRMTVLGVPLLFIVFLLCAFITHMLLAHTRWGRTVYMLGCNPVATEYSGIKVKKELFKVYLLSAALSFVGGAIMVSRYNSAKVDYGASYLLQSLTASVLGGISIEGGGGSVIGSVIAVAILQVISSGMNVLNVNRFFTDIITGLILILVLALNFVVSKLAAKRAKPV